VCSGPDETTAADIGLTASGIAHSTVVLMGRRGVAQGSEDGPEVLHHLRCTAEAACRARRSPPRRRSAAPMALSPRVTTARPDRSKPNMLGSVRTPSIPWHARLRTARPWASGPTYIAFTLPRPSADCLQRIAGSHSYPIVIKAKAHTTRKRRRIMKAPSPLGVGTPGGWFFRTLLAAAFSANRRVFSCSMAAVPQRLAIFFSVEW